MQCLLAVEPASWIIWAGAFGAFGAGWWCRSFWPSHHRGRARAFARGVQVGVYTRRPQFWIVLSGRMLRSHRSQVNRRLAELQEGGDSC